MSRCSSVLCHLLAALLWAGAFAVSPAHAGITINSITVVPNPLPSGGGAVPVYVDCTESANSTVVPGGSATLTDSQGTVLSQDNFAFSSDDSQGNPIVYTYLVVQKNASATASVSVNINVSLSDSLGSTATRSITVTQSPDVPILINSLTASPNPVPATGGTVAISADLTTDSEGQNGFYNGNAYLTNSAGQSLDIEPLFAPDSNPLYHAQLSHLPANTSASPQNYTVSIVVEDNLGIYSSSSISVSVLPAAQASTALAVPDASSVVGQPASLKAGLTLPAGGALSGEPLTFQVDNGTVGTATTGSNGWVTLSDSHVSSLGVGSHSLTVNFAGNGSFKPSSKTSALVVEKAQTGTAVSNAAGADGQTLTLTATLHRNSDSALLSDKSIRFTLDGAALGTALTNAQGVAGFSYQVPGSEAAGAHTVVAAFSGDAGDSASSGSGTLTVSSALPEPLSAIAASPVSLVGGHANATGMVALAGRTAATATITLHSSNPSALSVPATVTIRPTYTTVHFTATSHAVTQSTSVTITATCSGVSKTASVTVTPPLPPLIAVQASPASVVGAMANTTGMVALAGRAVTTAIITLHSSNPSALSVPATVTIRPTYTTVHFTAISHAVNASTTVTLTASYNGVTKTVTVTVTPILGSVTLSAAQVKGGSANPSGVVGLMERAPKTVVVTLTSSNPSALSVPASVTINSTYTTVHFTATSHGVTKNTSVTITAAYEGTSRTTKITVTP